MMTDQMADSTGLAQKRCFHHGAREAVARCPQCKRFFCRECITEHEDQVLCKYCLKDRATSPEKRFGGFRRFYRVTQLAIGTVIIWLVFYYVGYMLILIPTAFHEGTIWNVLP